MKKYDFIIVGSGFGGSVSAMRLTQKGYKVLVLEKGKKYMPQDFAKTNWNLRKFIWAPLLRCFGIQQITLLNKIMILHGAGVGGGSLVYANTLMKPSDAVLSHSSWPKSFSSNSNSYYDLAKTMLGVTENKIVTAADKKLQLLGKRLNVPDTFHLTEVGVNFDAEGSEPYFSGAGPKRQACTGCGACMIGCRVGAKNTLDKNYLYFAEKWGCEIKPETTVEKITPLAKGGYEIVTSSSTAIFKKSETYTADHVILAAGVVGTLKILFANKFKHKTLPKISDTLGADVRTNGESLCGATALNDDLDYSEGIAIGSAIHPDSFTKIEPVRYPRGSDLMRLLSVPLTGDGSALTRPLKLLGNIFLKFIPFAKLYFSRSWANRTIILLVMQTLEEKITIKYKRSFFTLFKKDLVCSDENHAIKSYLPIAQKASSELADLMQGIPQNVISEVLLATPATAHILGGCQFGSVINEQHEIIGYKNLYIMDGSVIPANLGVNPSLTITALAESFTHQFPTSEGMSPKDSDEREIRFS